MGTKFEQSCNSEPLNLLMANTLSNAVIAHLIRKGDLPDDFYVRLDYLTRDGRAVTVGTIMKLLGAEVNEDDVVEVTRERIDCLWLPYLSVEPQKYAELDMSEWLRIQDFYASSETLGFSEGFGRQVFRRIIGHFSSSINATVEEYRSPVEYSHVSAKRRYRTALGSVALRLQRLCDMIDDQKFKERVYGLGDQAHSLAFHVVHGVERP